MLKRAPAGSFPPPTGCFAPLKGPLPGRSLHRLDVFGLWDAYKREDSSTDWRNWDSEVAVSGRISPLTGRIGLLMGLSAG